MRRLIAYRTIVSDIAAIDQPITTNLGMPSGLSWVIHGARNSYPIFGRGRAIPLLTCYTRICHSRESRLVSSAAVAGGICKLGRLSDLTLRDFRLATPSGGQKIRLYRHSWTALITLIIACDMTYYHNGETRTFDLSATSEWDVWNAFLRKIMLVSELGVHRCVIPLPSPAKWLPGLVIDSTDRSSLTEMSSTAGLSLLASAGRGTIFVLQDAKDICPGTPHHQQLDQSGHILKLMFLVKVGIVQIVKVGKVQIMKIQMRPSLLGLTRTGARTNIEPGGQAIILGSKGVSCMAKQRVIAKEFAPKPPISRFVPQRDSPYGVSRLNKTSTGPPALVASGWHILLCPDRDFFYLIPLPRDDCYSLAAEKEDVKQSTGKLEFA
ncbi:hypothetical protein HD553DRAFT_327316 [Filobasidium floriforme]|uniref:uncharacterized protein n=1 Tax=Filobasidium floriforme TaxID=5210 RepID=UPI001E8CD9FC|nr:uncharacterized protein HD553DRAFT_327316 [Filobasidium floriforme]KAH8077432.1 hypothetical protein HD553DRAFT_327316 [Filobasidium floriforme]